MTTFLIISLSILSGIYLERGRKWIIRKINDYREVRDIKAYRSELQEISKHVMDRQNKIQHAMEDRLGNEMPFAGGRVCRPGY